MFELILKAITALAPIAEKLLTRSAPEDGASARQGTAAGEAARRASKGPFSAQRPER